MAKTDLGDAFARYTGGRHLSVVRQKGLEQAIAQVGEELHTQYIVSFAPAGVTAGEFHRIEVSVRGRPELTARTRPGYWVR